jgi:protein-S-isoprenylcysteine O-methyltransferase Ste14
MNDTGATASLVGRTLVLCYGVISYFVGVAGLACIIVVLAGFMPFGFLASAKTTYPIAMDVVLVALWGAIHTLMARTGFKARLTRVVPESAERPTYVLVAGITSVLLVGLWQPVPGVIWSVTNPTLVGVLWSVFAFGWVYLLAATFAINHFDLFGLRQVYLNFREQPRAPVRFVKRAMYRFSRHPIQTGVLIGVWVTPLMTATQIVLSIGFTVYIFVGLWFEEKDLVAHIGEPYRQYRQEAGMFLPRIFRRGAARVIR